MRAYLGCSHPTRGGVEVPVIKLKIEGMTCGHCAMAVKQALAAVAGVQAPVEVSVEQGEAVVSGSPDPQALKAAVVEEGYVLTSWTVVN